MFKAKHKKYCHQVVNCLKSVSVGTYNHGIFYKKTQSYSSCIGGCLTILGIITVILYAIIELWLVFEK